MDARCHIEMLGGLQVVQGERVITRFRTHKTGALLAYLAFYRDQRQAREMLVDLLWPESDATRGPRSLSTALASLRRQLDPPGVPRGTLLQADRFSVQLNPAAVTTDVAEFEAALLAAEQARNETERRQFLQTAMDLYRGELLPGYYQEWVLPEQRQLNELFFQAAQALIQHLERVGDWEPALEVSRRAVGIDPWREEGQEGLMRLLVAAGKPSAALQQYREWERILREELGTTPPDTTRQQAQEIESQTPSRPSRDASPSHQPFKVASQPVLPPTGTVTFLLTDLEDSTALAEKFPKVFPKAVEDCHRLLREAFRSQGGYEVQESEGGFIVGFDRAEDAIAAAVAGQQDLAAHPWPSELSALSVQMALDTETVEIQEGSYPDPVFEHARKLLLAGHGRQILCSERTAILGRGRLEPGVRLVELGVYRLRGERGLERVFQVNYPEMETREFGPLRVETGYAHQLPVPFTRFFGREEDISWLEEMLLREETHLVTMTGPGGSGKTRLALETARQLLEGFHGAVWFVPLQHRSDPGQIPQAIVEALRLPQSPQEEPLEQVVEVLSPQPSLVLLDNFEHLLAERKGAGSGSVRASSGPSNLPTSQLPNFPTDIIRTLLERLPTLTLLVTSRQVLNLTGEREFAVAPLPVPRGGDSPEWLLRCPSVQLFVDRAQEVRPDFQVTEGNASVVAELCFQLEGIPLALELAAVWAQVLTPAQMVAQLGHRFDFLVSRKRDVIQRHRSLRATMEWSYQLLTPELQQFFAGLSVFRGGWTVDAAEAICEESQALDYLEQLRECSLVQTEEIETEMRYRMLETVREYGWGQLKESRAAEEVRRRHLDWFVSLAQNAEPELRGSAQEAWLERLERERDNLQTALVWAEEKDPEKGLRLGGSLWQFWNIRGYVNEGRTCLEKMLSESQSQMTTARGKALHGAGVLAHLHADYEAARAFYEESLRVWQAMGDKRRLAESLDELGHLFSAQWELKHEPEDCERAQALFTQSLTLRRQLEDPSGVAASLNALGFIAMVQGEHERAVALCEESLAVRRELGDKCGIAHALQFLANLATHRENYEWAQALSGESLALRREIGDKQGISDSLWMLGIIASQQRDYAGAKTLLEESLTLKREVGNKPRTANVLADLGEVSLALRDYPGAKAFFTESLTLFREIRNKRGCIGCLERLARMAYEAGQTERAARLFGAVETLHQVVVGDPLIAVEIPTLPDAADEEARSAAWAAGRAMSLEKAVSYAIDHSPGPESET